MPPIVYPIELSLPDLSVFAIWSLAVAGASTILLVGLFLRNPWRICRPAFSFAGLVNLLYQWPIAVLAAQLESSLATPFYFSLTPNLLALIGILWPASTNHNLTIPVGTTTSTDLTVLQLIIPVIAAAVLGALYFSRMPAHCTALFALLFDPAATLLAREVTIKLSGSTLAALSFGALANSVAPVIAAIGLSQMIHGFRARSMSRVAQWALAVLASLLMVMTAGAKGLTIPLFVVVLVSAIFWSHGLLAKLVTGAMSVLLLFVALAGFELARERGGGRIPYDFAACSVELGSDEKGMELLNSIKESGGLGLAASQVAEIQADLAAKMGSADRTAKEPIFNESFDKKGGAAELESSAGEPAAQRTFGERKGASVDRAFTYLQAIVYRGIIAPTQVAAWHHLYVDEVGPPGIGAFPLAGRVLGTSVNPAMLVYQRYGTVYSSGDKTSTSTAPTSFIFSWPAYFSWWGILMAVGAILALDITASAIATRLPRETLPLAAGLVSAISLNMITSDFVTTIFSHGALVALCLLAAFAFVERISRSKKQWGLFA
ncbi:hypothetical protein [Pseudaminobacter sp. NGMCC 1.201702]|uniref:hypothetical protein n=1 Tax=Pseudaminobacter sp. NGMCC 1.201702 TaxID=3391825 RepID=UPI0039F0803E